MVSYWKILSLTSKSVDSPNSDSIEVVVSALTLLPRNRTPLLRNGPPGLEILNHPHVAIEFLPKKSQIPAVGRRNCPGEEGGFLLP